jgi:hypothetical protein
MHIKKGDKWGKKLITYPEFIALSIKTRIFSKKFENIFTLYPIVLNTFNLKVGKNLPF